MPPRISKNAEQYTRTFIREWRKDRNLSQDRLVERVRERVLSFSKSSLSRIENGRQPYSQPILEAIAWAIGDGCQPQDLIMREPRSKTWDLYDSLRTLKPEQQEVVADLVETLRRRAA